MSFDPSDANRVKAADFKSDHHIGLHVRIVAQILALVQFAVDFGLANEQTVYKYRVIIRIQYGDAGQQTVAASFEDSEAGKTLRVYDSQAYCQPSTKRYDFVFHLEMS